MWTRWVRRRLLLLLDSEVYGDHESWRDAMWGNWVWCWCTLLMLHPCLPMTWFRTVLMGVVDWDCWIQCMFRPWLRWWIGVTVRHDGIVCTRVSILRVNWLYTLISGCGSGVYVWSSFEWVSVRPLRKVWNAYCRWWSAWRDTHWWSYDTWWSVVCSPGYPQCHAMSISTASPCVGLLSISRRRGRCTQCQWSRHTWMVYDVGPDSWSIVMPPNQ